MVSSKSTVVQGGALGITHNNANGSSKTEVAMMDMNGDGFPDIIAGGTIQYTNSQGGLSGEIYKGIGANNSDNASQAWGYGRALKKVPNFKLHSLFLNFNSCPRSISSFKSEILFWTGI